MLPIVAQFLLFLARLLAFALILYFLAAVLFLVNRTRRIPSLKAVLRVMLVGAKGFPGIAWHRLKLAPVRVKETLQHRGRAHVVHPAYPEKPKSRSRRGK